MGTATDARAQEGSGGLKEEKPRMRAACEGGHAPRRPPGEEEPTAPHSLPRIKERGTRHSGMENDLHRTHTCPRSVDGAQVAGRDATLHL